MKKCPYCEIRRRELLEVCATIDKMETKIKSLEKGLETSKKALSFYEKVGGESEIIVGLKARDALKELGVKV